jgi:hypothetical protein
MKTMRSLHGIHSGTAVWIAGSGPSLSEYPDDFAVGKVMITLHLAHVKFPQATWRYANEYDRVEYLARRYPDFREQPNVFSLPFFGESRARSLSLAGAWTNTYWHRLCSYPPRGNPGDIDAGFTAWKVRRSREGRAAVWGGHRTCLHGAIFAAVHMGAAEVNLIGCDHGLVNAESEHFSTVVDADKRMRPNVRLFSDPMNNVPMIAQTLVLVDTCREAGIPLNWYRCYSQPMGEIMEVDRQWVERERLRILASLPPLVRLKRRIKAPIHSLINLF